MISYIRFIELLETLLLDPLFLISQGYSPSCSTKIEHFDEYLSSSKRPRHNEDFNGHVIWSHEEPLNSHDLSDLKNLNNLTKYPEQRSDCRLWRDIGVISEVFYDVNFHVFANSEISKLKKDWLKSFANGNGGTLYHSYHDWYFFFHGFVCLDWYRDFKKIYNPGNLEITKVFMCLNHLISDKRNYRLHLLSHLYEKDIIQYGLVSCPNLSIELIKKELLQRTSPLSTEAKKHVYTNLSKNADPLIIDATDYNKASADIPYYSYAALWNIVTETIYYDEKLHLTEKIFKPIVTKRPFILVGAPENLAYLRSYGFKTFDRWIDESYDLEHDPDRRMSMIADEISKLCHLPWNELMAMYQDMHEVLEYNHQHFFGDFKNIIVEELVENFKTCTKIYNLHKSERYRLPVENLDFEKIKKTLLD